MSRVEQRRSGIDCKWKQMNCVGLFYVAVFGQAKAICSLLKNLLYIFGLFTSHRIVHKCEFKVAQMLIISIRRARLGKVVEEVNNGGF